jgi:hypothetical protein
MKNKNQFQQGDVICEKVNIDINGKQKVKKVNNEWVLAHGESGHHHFISETKKADIFEYYDDELKEQCLLLKVLENQTEIKHEEHKSIWLDKGTYRINKVNEYDPFERFAKKVID